MSDFLSMFNYGGKTAKVLGKSRINTYKDIYLHIEKKQGSELNYNGNYLNGNELAEKIYKEKYYIKDLDNKLLENSPEDVFKRLASFIATVEPTKSKQYSWSEKFYNELYEGRFVPGGRVLAGAGDIYRIKTLANCFVTKIQSDDIDSIYQAAFECARTYSYGGGIDDNVASEDITESTAIEFQIQSENLSGALIAESQNSVSFTNPKPASGGSAGQSIREVRDSALAYYQAQQRAVTKEDYIVRAYALPARYGNIAKVHLLQDDQINTASQIDDLDRIVTQDDVDNKRTLRALTSRVPNPLALNMYTLGYNSNKVLEPLSLTVKENLKNYLSEFRLVTDAVNIKDAYIIDIAVDFAILTKVDYNKNDVLLRCVSTLKEFFNIDNWQIGQPIIMSDIVYQLSLIEGVAAVTQPLENNPEKLPIVTTNKFRRADGYSGNTYDIQSATINGTIYPALDPSIFQVRFPNTDIRGKVVGDNLGVTE